MLSHTVTTGNSRTAYAILALVILLLLIATMLFLTTRTSRVVFDSDPIVSYAHGTFYWPQGVSAPKSAYLLNVQRHYILKYERNVNRYKLNDSSGVKDIIYRTVSDNVLANALYIDWLIQQTEEPKFSRDIITNHNIRWYYISTVQVDPLPLLDQGVWTKGIDINSLKELQFAGIDIFATADAGKGKENYRDECIAAGVPVPSSLFDTEWQGSFGSVEKAAAYNELHMFLSQEPQGTCLSLIRSDSPQGTTGHIDLICMGQQSGKACFFEAIGYDNNIDGVIAITELDAGEGIPIGSGSAAPCTQCHVGENAFIIHPEDPSFVAALQAKSLFFSDENTWNATNYYQAFGVPSWPSNPPPLDLSLIPSDKSCSGCHVGSYAGRFPDVAKMPDPTLYSAYCNNVLVSTLSNTPVTMPLNDVDNSAAYAGHKNYLTAMCDKTNDGKVVDNTFDDDPAFVSPPRLVLQLYQCAQAVYVDSYIEGAQVELVINDKVEAVGASSQFPQPIKFSNIDPLEQGDRVQTRQQVNGTWSELSASAVVTRYQNDYPDGLPAPTIDPSTVFSCASMVAVRYDIPGVDVQVWVNGENPVSALTFAGHVPVTPAKTPFEFNDEFTAQVSICGELSPLSESVVAQRTSSENLVEAIINPFALYEGQRFIDIGNLTYGSASQVLEQNAGMLGGFSTPMSWQMAGISQPLELTDQLSVTQTLCDFSSQPGFSPSPSVLSCSVLAAPEIHAPLANDNFVRVLNPVLGARVHVYDTSGNELGDGTGMLIPLKRKLLVGEVITTTQQVGACVSSTGYQIQV